jgi:hypothetical protein
MKQVFFGIVLIEIICFLFTGCAGNIKDLSFHADIEVEEHGMKEEIGVDMKM